MFILWKAYYNILSYIIHAHPIDNIQPNAHIYVPKSSGLQAESWSCRPLKSVTTAGVHLQTMDFLYEIYEWTHQMTPTAVM